MGEFAQRVRIARSWLEQLAPDRYKVAVSDELPAAAGGLSEAQRSMLGALADAASSERPDAGDQWQDLIFRTAQAQGVTSAEAFAAIYAAFLGRANGPRAGWLLASLDRAFTIGRLREAATAMAVP